MNKIKMLHKYYWITGLFTAMAFLLTLASAENMINIKAKEKCTVAGEKILLSDIATISTEDNLLKQKLENLEIGFSPYIGMSRNLTAKEIKIRLKQNNIPLERVNLDFPESVYVTRDFQTLNSKEIEKTVSKYFDKKFASNPDIKLKRIRGAQNLTLPAGKISTNIEIVRKSISGNTYSILFTVFVNGKKSAFLQLSADVEKIEDIVVARKKIFRNQIITEKDVTVIRKISDMRTKNNFSKISDVIGKKATRLIDVNKAITSDMVEEIPLLERGDVVSIRVISNGLMVSALGEVLSKGYQGKKVKVRNIDSGKILKATVMNKKEVRIEL
ncbi:MAG: flagella basal body P-ring formation protein FlgA [Candidatus Schekmanbacteria bacterium]|nr:MAG: flagella basal body P-ring formation protein FlgA [Candidatus Schekmanbacteria bacterium]